MKIDWFYLIAIILTVVGFIIGIISVSHYDIEPLLQEPNCGVSCMDKEPEIIPTLLGLGAVGLILFVALGIITFIGNRLENEEKE